MTDMESWDKALEALEDLRVSGDEGSAHAFRRHANEAVEELHHELEAELIRLLNGG